MGTPPFSSRHERRPSSKSLRLALVLDQPHVASFLSFGHHVLAEVGARPRFEWRMGTRLPSDQAQRAPRGGASGGDVPEPVAAGSVARHPAAPGQFRQD